MKIFSSSFPKISKNYAAVFSRAIPGGDFTTVFPGNLRGCLYKFEDFSFLA